MSRLLRSAVLVCVGVFLAGQLIRPARTNPPTDPARTLGARLPVTPAASAVMNRACRDCHSNDSRWPWYTNVTPTNWFVANHVHHAREHLNYSLWATYDEDEQDKFLGNICSLAQRRRMPLPSYLLVHRGAKLSDVEIKTLCDWTEKMRDMLE